MSGERFTLDTNVLVYSLDRDAGERHAIAVQIIELAVCCDCWLTLQAVSEFYAATTRKRLVPAADAAAQAADWLDMFPTAAASAGAIRQALASAAVGRASYWDGLLLATAAEAGCRVVLTEDMGSGTMLHGVRVVDPFGPAGLAAAARMLLAAD